MNHEPTHVQLIDLGTVVVWAIVNIIGWTVGWFISGTNSTGADNLLSLIVQVLSFGTAIAIGQWLALRHAFPRPTLALLANFVAWAAGTFVGFGVGALYIANTPGATQLVYFVWFGAALGILVGALQWLLWFRHIRYSFLWILVNPPLLALVCAASFYILVFLATYLDYYVGVVFSGIVGGAVYGLISGTLLAWFSMRVGEGK